MAKSEEILSKLDEISKRFDEHSSSRLEILNKILDKLDNILGQKLVNPPIQTETAPVITPSAIMPVPIEYREIVSTILNPQFDVRIIPRPNTPLFEFIIVVPKVYSTVKEGEDLRVKVLNFAEGVNGVREYAELVYKSLQPEIQARVVADKMT